jgi:hypothetical protein
VEPPFISSFNRLNTAKLAPGTVYWLGRFARLFNVAGECNRIQIRKRWTNCWPKTALITFILYCLKEAMKASFVVLWPGRL